MTTITTTDRGVTEIVHDNGVQHHPLRHPRRTGTVTQLLAANVAEFEKWVRKDQTDPVAARSPWP